MKDELLSRIMEMSEIELKTLIVSLVMIKQGTPPDRIFEMLSGGNPDEC